ncbi:MAG: DUF4093 domain-containing protein [Bacilli bacterium]
MKLNFEGIIVVEGKEDASYLSSLIDTEIVMTNGYEIPISEIAYLNAVSSKKKILIMTDSDSAGEAIRSRIKISNARQIRVPLDKCNKNNKHGVAECQKEEIIHLLKPFCSKKIAKVPEINSAFLCSLGLNKKDLRTIFAKKVSVGLVNMKGLVRRLNSLDYTKEKIIEIMGEM